MLFYMQRKANNPKSYRTVAKIDFSGYVLQYVEHQNENRVCRRRETFFKYISLIFLLVRSFNLPRVAQQLERLMGSRWERESLVCVELLNWSDPFFSVVRLTDRKYMLDLQKRIQEDYHDTLMKRISQRQVRTLYLIYSSRCCGLNDLKHSTTYGVFWRAVPGTFQNFSFISNHKSTIW